MNKTLTSYHNELQQAIQGFDLGMLENISKLVLETYEKGGTIYFMGNGGSASTASHMSGDFLKGASMGLDKKFKTICLSDNTTAMMAIANDISYDAVFVEPLKNYLQPDDLVIGISGSGNSANVVKAMEFAKSQNVSTVALCGFSGGKIHEMATLSFHVPCRNMEIVEDAHHIALHMIKTYLIKALNPGEVSMGKIYDDRVK